MEQKVKKTRRLVKDERGFTPLEYCAGAAVVVLVLYGAMNTLGVSIGNFMGEIGAWAGKRQAEVSAKN